MPSPSPPAADSPPGGSRTGLERPVLTVTGAVGLLWGSLAWALTDQFAAAPLVFAASLATALALAATIETRSAAGPTKLPDDPRTAARLPENLEPAASPSPGAADCLEDLELNGVLLAAVAAAEDATRVRDVTLGAEPSPLYLAVHAHPAALERSLAALLTHAIQRAPAGGAVVVRSDLVDARAVVEAEIDGEPGSRSRFTLSLPFGHRSGGPAVRPGSRTPPANPSAPAPPPRPPAPPGRSRSDARPAHLSLPACQDVSMHRATAFPPAPTTAAGAAGPPPRVVVCDDEPHITLAVALKLRKAGFAVETHPDGLAAWESVAADPPDLLVTDCQMPRMSGLELLRALRREPRTAAVPAIMLTGKGFELDAAAMQREMGPVRLFPKPFSPRELLDAVTALTTAATAV